MSFARLSRLPRKGGKAAHFPCLRRLCAANIKRPLRRFGEGDADSLIQARSAPRPLSPSHGSENASPPERQTRLLGPPVRALFPGTGKSYHMEEPAVKPQQRLAAAVSARICAASSAVAAPEAIRQRQLPSATPGTLIRPSLPRPR